MKNKHILLFLLLATTLNACSSANNKNTTKLNNDQTNISQNNTTTIDNSSDIMFLSTVYFDFDSYKMNTEAKNNIDLLANYLKNSKNINKKVRLDGYCDELGTEEYNYNLGLKRANKVKNYLTSLGINKTRIIVSSYGKKQDKKGNTEEILKLNRKVVINFE